jgi:hypothetical protein
VRIRWISSSTAARNSASVRTRPVRVRSSTWSTSRRVAATPKSLARSSSSRRSRASWSRPPCMTTPTSVSAISFTRCQRDFFSSPVRNSLDLATTSPCHSPSVASAGPTACAAPTRYRAALPGPGTATPWLRRGVPGRMARRAPAATPAPPPSGSGPAGRVNSGEYRSTVSSPTPSPPTRRPMPGPPRTGSARPRRRLGPHSPPGPLPAIYRGPAPGPPSGSIAAGPGPPRSRTSSESAYPVARPNGCCRPGAPPWPRAAPHPATLPEPMLP